MKKGLRILGKQQLGVISGLLLLFFYFLFYYFLFYFITKITKKPNQKLRI